MYYIVIFFVRGVSSFKRRIFSFLRVDRVPACECVWLQQPNVPVTLLGHLLLSIVPALASRTTVPSRVLQPCSKTLENRGKRRKIKICVSSYACGHWATLAIAMRGLSIVCTLCSWLSSVSKPALGYL